MSRYKAYDEYKDSGVLGLEMIPQSWKTIKIKFIYSIGRGRVISQEELKDEGIYPVYSSQTQNNGCLGFIDTYDFDCTQITWTTDGANAGTVFLREGKHNCTNVCGTLQTKTSSSFNNYVLYCLHYITKFYKRPDTNGAKIMNNEMAEIIITFPSLIEQKTIAEFLDYETGKIDKLIEKQQELIALLEEKRQAVISHAVTKGLNPNVPMKNSGVEWLGEIPEHWSIAKFNFCVSIANGQVDPKKTPYSEMLLIAPNHIESGTGRIIGKESAKEQGADSGKYRCDAGDIIYSKIRPALKKVGIAPEDCLCSADMYPMKGNKVLSNHYIFWYLLSDNFSTFAILESDRVAMPKINRESLAGCYIPIPSEREQQEIVNYINMISQLTDILISKAKQAIELMQERRTALISAAVTGKIDVRGWKKPKDESLKEKREEVEV